jgi:hypothetical protein
MSSLSYFGTPVHESLLAVSTVPVRRHRKRRNQTAQYHARVQKKWVKRFGQKKVPSAFVMDLRAMGLGWGKAIYAHPDIVRELRRAAGRAYPPFDHL